MLSWQEPSRLPNSSRSDVTTGFWHRSWGAVAVRHLDVRLRGAGSCETAYALSPHIRN